MNFRNLKLTLLSIQIAALGLVPPATVLADPLTGEEKESLLLELSTIQEVLNGSRVSSRTSAVQSFQAASVSDKAAYEFYLQCHKNLKFDPRDASFSEFRDWRDRNEARIKTESNLAAMRLQLQYLVLTLRAAEGVKLDAIIPELETFVGNIVKHSKDLGSDGMKTLQASVKKTIFAEAYKLDKSLEIDNWNFSPGDFGASYDKTIFPYVRGTKPEALAAAWDRRINLEKSFFLATQTGNPVALSKFEAERLPQLYWRKATDIYRSFSEQQGALSMLQLLKANPSHPDLKKWVEEFREMLLNSPKSEKEGTSEDEVRPTGNNPLGFENF